MPRVRRMWIWARLSAIGGTAVLRAVDVADLPRLGVKLGGVRRWRRPGIGRAASICLVAAARKSPRVQAAGAVTRGRERRMVIRGVANRAGGQGERADLVSSLGIPCWASCWASGWAWRWASGPCWAGAASKVDAVRFGRFLDGLGWPRRIGRWVCRGGLHLLRCLCGLVCDGRGLSSQWQRGSSKASRQRVRRDLQRLGVGDLACQGLAGWVAILIPMRVRVIYAWHDCVVGGPLGAGGDVVLCWRGVGASALRLVAKGASQRAGGDRCQVTRALRTWATSGRARGQSSRRGAAFARRASSAILLFFPPHFPHLAKPRELWGPPAAGQGSIVRPVVCLVGGGAAATVRVREPGQPASTTMPSARPRRLDKRQPTVSTAMPSARPSGASEVRRRLRPRRRPWPPSVRRSAPLPPAPGAPSPGPRSPLVAGAGCPAAAATVIDTGYWRVRMVGGEGRMRAGMDSTISRMAARRMLVGSRVRAVTRKVARSARERVLGWSRSIQQLLPRRCSAVDRCQACAAMPRSSSWTLRSRESTTACASLLQGRIDRVKPGPVMK
ncbi:uncharacterized protein [Triticum aestivum]|uniref:uncharacterized protein n=1 Tax=Triticum aestivum TaxID=4565 RepID=UPI001D009D21|nr:uncharacterized protein LOC123187754 [Triticum aestivum]